MKKLLIATSALVGAAALATAAQAEDPKVMVGGVIDFQAGFASDDLDSAQRGHGFRNDSEISFTVQGKSDSGLGYGAVIDLEADVTADANNEGINAARTYVYLDGNFGRFELGSNAGAAETLAVEADSLARATGGIDGDWVFFANAPGSAFISTPALLPEHGSAVAFGDESTANANKINYYSPRFSGIQLGLSYSPDLDDRGQSVTRTDNAVGYGDIIELGANYEGNWDDFGFTIGATGVMGDADTNAQEDLRNWNIGTAFSVMGVSLAGSYGDYDDTFGNGTDADYYTLGAGYDFGPFGASVTYLNSEVDLGAASNEFDNLSVGVDYMVAPGMTPYIEASFFDADSAAGVDNDGNVVILGTELAF